MNNLKFVRRIGMFTLFVFCLSFMMVPFAGASELIQDNHLSESDLSINQSHEQVSSGNISNGELKKITAEVTRQKDEAEAKVMKRIIEGANTNNPAQTSTLLRTTYGITGRDASYGGYGAGNCDSYWKSLIDVNRNGCIAELYGSKWAKGWGWMYFRPSSSRNYTIGINYSLTGRILGGSLNIKLKVTDISSGSTDERTCFTATSGYFDSENKSNSKTFYLTSGRNYAITWEADTDASTVGAGTMSDFLTTEFNGTERNITFNNFSIN